MTRVAYINASAGIAGDMLLGALIDAGADVEAVGSTLGGLGVDGWAVTFERVQRGGIAATWANVVTDTPHDHGHDHDDHHPHRPARVITELLAAADLPGPVRATAQRIFDTLAAAEGEVHGIDPADVEFHEVGAVDAIVDVVGVAAALHSLGIDRIVAAPIGMGHGTTRSAHGVLPNPPPAVARLLAQRSVPVIGVDTPMELATPTGVAILVAMAESFGPLPAMTVEGTGYGAGTADPAGRPNVVQVLVGSETAESMTPSPGRAVVEIESNVDDVTGEVLAHTISSLLAAGALDAWAAPIVMKKGRPAHTVHALCDPHDVERLAALVLNETGSLGVRATTMTRWPQRRVDLTVDVDGHPVRVKLAGHRAKPELDDALVAAVALGRPLRDVLRLAETAALALAPDQ